MTPSPRTCFALALLLVACKGSVTTSTNRIEKCATDAAGWRHVPPPPPPDGQPAGFGVRLVTWTGHVAYLWDGGAEHLGLELDPSSGATRTMGVQGADTMPTLFALSLWTGTAALYSSDGRDLFEYRDRVWSQRASDRDAPPRDRGIASAWTGDRVIIWTGNYLGSYDPTSDTWTAGNMTGAPESITYEAHGTWTGKELVVWSTSDAVGGRYDPVADAWRPMSAVGAPVHNAIAFIMAWVAPYVIVWGGGEGVTDSPWPKFPTATGGRYDVDHDTWLPMTTEGAPPALLGQRAVSTGKHLVVFGGTDEVTGPQSDAYRYDPVADRWDKLTGACIDPHVAVGALAWLDHQVLVWGSPGANPENPQPDQGWLLPLSP